MDLIYPEKEVNLEEFSVNGKTYIKNTNKKPLKVKRGGKEYCIFSAVQKTESKTPKTEYFMEINNKYVLFNIKILNQKIDSIIQDKILEDLIEEIGNEETALEMLEIITDSNHNI